MTAAERNRLRQLVNQARRRNIERAHICTPEQLRRFQIEEKAALAAEAREATHDR